MATFANIVVRGNGGLQREGAIVNSTMTGSAIMRCWGLAGPRVELAARRLKVVDVDCLPPTGQCPVAGGALCAKARRELDEWRPEDEKGNVLVVALPWDDQLLSDFKLLEGSRLGQHWRRWGTPCCVYTGSRI